MFKGTIKYQFKNNSINGIYCNISPDGKKVFRIVYVENKNGKLSFNIVGEVEDNISELKILVKTTPVYLVLDGKGVLLKNIVAEPDKPLIKQIIPSAIEEEFITDVYAGNNSLHVAIARKDLVDEVTDQFKQAGLNVICLSLGPYRIANIIRYFGELPEVVLFENNLIEYDKQNHVIKRFERTDKNDKNDKNSFIIDSKEVESSFLPALSVALEYFLEDGQECEHPESKEQKKEFQSKILFQRAGLGFLMLILVVLLANMFIYMHYNDKKQQLDNQLTGNKNILNTLDTLKREVEWKEKFMKESGILKETKMAFYADRIAETVPGEITLDKLEIHPVTSKIRNNKEISLKPNVILLDGLTKSSLKLNDWVHKIRQLKWVDNVEILNYNQNTELNMGAFSVELNIKQAND